MNIIPLNLHKSNFKAGKLNNISFLPIPSKITVKSQIMAPNLLLSVKNLQY